jgi:hypothetical protein
MSMDVDIVTGKPLGGVGATVLTEAMERDASRAAKIREALSGEAAAIVARMVFDCLVERVTEVLKSDEQARMALRIMNELRGQEVRAEMVARRIAGMQATK